LYLRGNFFSGFCLGCGFFSDFFSGLDLVDLLTLETGDLGFFGDFSLVFRIFFTGSGTLDLEGLAGLLRIERGGLRFGLVFEKSKSFYELEELGESKF
jgi:hypothetical protein